MSLQEILESEKRNSDNLYDIHFYMEGLFWRAYEWSAYLSRIFPSSLNEDERLKPLKKVTKNGEYVHVGLQLASFEKYLPNVTNNNAVFEMLDKHIVIHAKSFFSDSDFSEYEKILKNWKSKISLSKKEKKKQAEMNDEHVSEITIDSLINEIVSYPIEKKNLIENTYFLSHIKGNAIKMANKTNS